jgi:hypothetical protein
MIAVTVSAMLIQPLPIRSDSVAHQSHQFAVEGAVTSAGLHEAELVKYMGDANFEVPLPRSQVALRRGFL